MRTGSAPPGKLVGDMCLRQIEASVIRRRSCGLVRGGRLTWHAAPGGRRGGGGADAPAAAPARSTAARAGRPRGAGLPVVGEIRVPGFLEGGDFFPAGRDLALVGIGLRSNFEAARQLMDGDLLGTGRLAVVRDDFEQHQARRRAARPRPGRTLPGRRACWPPSRRAAQPASGDVHVGTSRTEGLSYWG